VRLRNGKEENVTNSDLSVTESPIKGKQDTYRYLKDRCIFSFTKCCSTIMLNSEAKESQKWGC
jgi:hypothetical protein